MIFIQMKYVSMNNVFVTLFDSKYLMRGIVLHKSLCECCDDFKLYIIAFDELCCSTLEKLNLKNTIIISLDEFEDEELLQIKKKRNFNEYCWTATPKSILYIFDHYNEKICTYLDSDLMFFSDPRPIFSEMSDNEDVLITEHRFSDYCDQTNTSGKYCVQFVPVKNTENGRKIISWWSKKCIEYCGTDSETGHCGDQTYLSDWMERFDGVHEMRCIGGGVAPWNADDYSFCKEGDEVLLTERVTGMREKLVFYHFHGLRFFDKGVVRLAPKAYRIPQTAMAYVYKKYIKTVSEILQEPNLKENRDLFLNIMHYRDDDMDEVHNEMNYYLYDLFA